MKKIKGFELIELLIIVAIVGILLTVTVTQYEKDKEKKAAASERMPVREGSQRDQMK